MNDWQEETQRQLQRAMARIQDAVAQAQRQHAETLSRWNLAAGVADPAAARGWGRHSAKQARHEARRLRRELRRVQKLAGRRGHPLHGAVRLIAASGLGALALMNPGLHVLLIPAGIVGLIGLRGLFRAAPDAPALDEAQPMRSPAPPIAPAPPVDPRDERVEATCARIQLELKTSPGILKELMSQPEATVEALRKTCRELTRRERELRALLSPADDARLEAEHAALTARTEAEADAVARQRLQAALTQLLAQRQQRLELGTAASRFDAEHTRIAYTLESLYTQILRVRSADAASRDVAGAGLRQSLEQLGGEIDAVAEAMEAVNRGELSPLGPVGGGEGSGSPGTRERT